MVDLLRGSVRARRRAGWAVPGALLAAGLALLAVAGAAPPGPCPGAEVKSGASGTWTIHQGPRFEAGGEPISAFAVDGADPSRQYATNGTELKGSRDGGCSWQTLFTLPSQPQAPSPLTRGTAAIRQVAARGGRVVFTATGGAVTVAYASRDAGGSFRASRPMPDPGTGPGPLAIARSDANVVYLATGSQMRRSDDGGETFRALGGTLEPADALGGIATIAVDPRRPDRLVVRGGNASWHSTDGGQTFTRYAGASFDDTNSGPSFGSAGRVVFSVGSRDNAGVPHRDASAWLISDNGGGSFKKAKPSQFGYVQGEDLGLLAGGAPRDLMVVVGSQPAGPGGGVHRWHPGVNRLTPVDEFNLSPLRAAQFEDGEEPRAYFVRDDGRLVVWRSPDGGLDQLPLPPDPPAGAEPPPPPPTSKKTKEPPQPEDVPIGPSGTLAPGAGDVQVPAGGTTAVEYDLRIPQRPSRLDAFFLMDSSNSTEPYIARVGGHLDSLAKTLVERGIDGWFGLGEYQDNGENTGVRYRRRSDLRPPGDFLEKQFRQIETEGGAEPGYTALEQVATGRGIGAAPAVAPGMHANWRRGTVRMIVHAADEAFAADPGGPTKDQTFNALKSRDIHFVGLLVAPAPIPAGQGVAQCEPVEDVPAENPQTPVVAQPATTLQLLCQMQELARETDTLAPPGGVDCDGDGNQDLREGDPMVCVVTDGSVVDLAQIEDAMQRLILSYPLSAEAALAPAGEPEVGVQIRAKDDYSGIDPRVGAEAAFTVRFSCTQAQAGKRFDVPLRATLGGLPIADAQPAVVCGGLPAAGAAPAPRQAPDEPAPAKLAPEKAAVAAPAALPQAPVAAMASAPPPPPAFIEAPAIAVSAAPAPAPAPAPSGVSATSPVASSATAAGQVLAPAEQERVQPVFQTVQVEEDGGTADLNFSRADDPYAPGNVHWLLRTAGFAAVLGAAAGTARRRRRTTIQSTRKAHHR